MERIKVQSTKKQYQIVDQYDNELGIVLIDTSDTNMAKRAMVAKENILAYINEASQSAGDEDEKTAIDKITEIDSKIKEEVNTLMNYDVSSVVFGATNCLSTSGGVTFVERFLEAITPVIEKEFEQEYKAASSRVSKYTERYHK